MFSKASFDDYKDRYLKYLLEDRKEAPSLHYWDAQQNFSTIWNIEELDFMSMYGQSLSSNISNRVWTGIDYHPKVSLLTILKYEKEFVRSMFRDLFSESKDLQLRIGRFEYHCDQLLPMVQKKESKLMHHYHDDQILVAYLALNDPSRFVFLDISSFRIAMQYMQARNIPEYISIESYTKLMRIIHRFLVADQDLLAAYKSSFGLTHLYNPKSMVLALDFIHQVPQL